MRSVLGIFHTREFFFLFSFLRFYSSSLFVFFMSFLCTGLRWMTLCFFGNFSLGLIPFFSREGFWGQWTFLFDYDGKQRKWKWGRNGNRCVGSDPFWSVKQTTWLCSGLFFFFFFLERKEKMKISNQSCCKMLLQGGCGCDCDADVMLRGIWNVRWDGAQVMRRMDMGMDMDGVSL